MARTLSHLPTVRVSPRLQGVHLLLAGSKHVKSMPGPQRWLFLAEVREGASEQDLREGTPCELPSPPAHPLTFMDVAKDVQPWLDSPLDRVEQLHTAHTLHLLGDPV